MNKIEDTNGGKYTTYQDLTDAMLQYCKNLEANAVAAGFGNNKTEELLEFALEGLDHDSGLYDLAKGAAAFDTWIPFPKSP